MTTQDQDGLVHLTWTVREATTDGTSAKVPELDLVLFPGQATFSRLPGRRMFLLRYEGQEHFFWYSLKLWTLPVNNSGDTAQSSQASFRSWSC